MKALTKMTKAELLNEIKELRKLVDLHRQIWECNEALLECKDDIVEQLYEIDRLVGEQRDAELRRG